MVGHDASRSESDYGFSLPHLLGLAGLLLGIGLFLLISSSSPPDLPVQRTLQTKSTAAIPPKQVESPPAKLLQAAFTPIETEPIQPAVAERRRVSPKKSDSQKKSEPPIVAAVAEKPSAVVASESKPPEHQQFTEIELVSYLSNSVPTVGLDIQQAKEAVDQIRSAGHVLRPGSHLSHLPDSKKRPAAAIVKKQNTPHEDLQALLSAAKIEGLPFVEDKNCELDRDRARAMEKFSRQLHPQIAAIDRSPRRSTSDARSFSSEYHIAHRDAAVAHAIRYQSEYQTAEAVPAMVQILQAEGGPVREQLVELLAGVSNPEATRALADRAVFDLSPLVRQSANLALKNRPQKDFRAELLKAIRHPWPPVAWHAAEALVAVKDTAAVPFLIELLDTPDPARPYRDETGTFLVRELVRVNHFQNCLLCHAPARDARDLVLGPIPTPGQPIFSVYYGSQRSSRDILVRADVTYLRQDFSVMHTVKDASPWPDRQRFDYLVRTREATPQEIAAIEESPLERASDSPQREAVLFALRKLTGRSGGPASEHWR